MFQLSLFRLFPAAAALLLCGVVAGAASSAASRGGAALQNVYTVYTPDGRRTLPYREAGNTDLVLLDQLSTLFGLAVAEDSVLRGLVITTKGGERILAIPGQSFVQVAGNVQSLSAPVQRERNTWLVPIDFVSEALSRALRQRIVLRRSSHLVLVGDVRVPQVSGRFERDGAAGRLILEIEPPAPHKIAQEDGRVAVRFDAAAIDPRPIAGAPAEFVTATRIEGATLFIEFGSSAATVRVEGDDSRVAIDLLPPGPPPGTPPTTPAPAPLPSIDPLPGMLRTVVIDPGHGGEDTGVRGPGGLTEKDLTLQVARRLKGAIESRMGLRVLLTRDMDADVPIDRRTSLANNNKADLFVSLHANASLKADVRGAQVLSLSVADYRTETSVEDIAGIAVPVVGGGTRTIRAVPWDLAQLPFADRSAAVGAILLRELTARGVPRYARPAGQLPLRVLVGANMPAVLLEMGFLSNTDDEQALRGDLQATIVEALVATIAAVRRGLPEESR